MQASIETFHETDEDYYDYEVEFEFSASYTPAKLDGPWEDCYPEDGNSEFEILTVKRDGVEVEFDSLDNEVKLSLRQSVDEWVEENGLQAIQDDIDECRGEAQYDAMMDAEDFYADRC